jgi:CRP-like cAMP-binding protein
MAVTRTEAVPEPAIQTFRSFAIDGSAAREFPAAQSYPARVELFRQGDAPVGVFLVEHGLIKLMRVENDGRGIIVGLRASGWCVGAASVILGRPYLVSAVTVTPSSVSCMSADVFQAALRKGHALSWHLHEMHSREVHAEIDHVTEFHSLSARRRLERFLRRLEGIIDPRQEGNEVRLEIPLRQWEIAQLIGVTPPYLSELTRDLEARGLLRRERDSLILCRPRPR